MSPVSLHCSFALGNYQPIAAEDGVVHEVPHTFEIPVPLIGAVEQPEFPLVSRVKRSLCPVAEVSGLGIFVCHDGGLVALSEDLSRQDKIFAAVLLLLLEFMPKTKYMAECMQEDTDFVARRAINATLSLFEDVDNAILWRRPGKECLLQMVTPSFCVVFVSQLEVSRLVYSLKAHAEFEIVDLARCFAKIFDDTTVA